MAFSARRSLASGLSRHLTRRLQPSLSHLLPSYHDRCEDPYCASSAAPNHTQQPAPPFPSGDLRRRSRSQNLNLPLPFGAHLAVHRSFSSGPEVDAAAGVLSDAASSVVTAFPAPFPGEVAAAAADSFLPVAARGGLPFEVLPELKAANRFIFNATDRRTKLEGKMKLDEIYRKHGVTLLTPFTPLFIEAPIYLSFTYAIRNMIEKVPSMEGGGAYWFTNLTTPDELYILPVLIFILYAAELIMKVRLPGSPMQQKMKNLNLDIVLSVLIISISMSFCKAHFFYWVPWTMFGVASIFALRQPAVRQYFGIPLIAPPWSAPAAPAAPASEGPKPISADPPAAASGSGESSFEPMEKRVDVEKKR